MHRLEGKARLAVAIACIGVLGGCGAPSSPATSSPPSLVGTQLDHPVPKSLLSLPLTNSLGERVTLSSFRGKTVVVSDMMTLCQETCAIGTASMLEAARAVDRAGLTSQIEFLSITIDPGRDDVRHLAAYERSFGRLANWELLTGAPADVNELWDTLGVWRRTVSVSPPYPRDWLTHQPLTVDIQHTDDLIFISPDEHFRFEIDGPASVPSVHSLPSRIYGFMDGVGHQNVRRPSAGSWSARQVLHVLHWILQAGEPE
jgi:protein SCO1